MIKRYFWLDTVKGYLYMGDYSETGEKLRKTEFVILMIYPWSEFCAAQEEDPIGTWDQIDDYIEHHLGYLPDYEIN